MSESRKLHDKFVNLIRSVALTLTKGLRYVVYDRSNSLNKFFKVNRVTTGEKDEKFIVEKKGTEIIERNGSYIIHEKIFTYGEIIYTLLT